jgi:hypothetical protein
MAALLAATAAHRVPLAFIGPFGPRSRIQQGASSSPPQPVGKGLEEQEIRELLKGRTAVVVAADNLDIGLGVAAGLTELGARVIFASRQPKRAARACGQITQKALAKKGGGACVAATVDLADPASVYEFADGLVDKGQPLHVLVNCADEVLPSYQEGAAGWEQTAATNHLGPFLLTELLLDQMVGTMRRDEAKSAQLAAAKAADARRQRQRRGPGGDGDAARPPLARPVELRPSPAPLARVVTLGRRAHPTLQRPSPVAGLGLARRNFSTWRASWLKAAVHPALGPRPACLPGPSGSLALHRRAPPQQRGGSAWPRQLASGPLER